MLGSAAHSIGRRARTCAIVAALATLALAPAAADAHLLRVDAVTKAIKQASFKYAGQIDGTTSSDGGRRQVQVFSWGPCKRANAHRWNCKMGNKGDVVYADGRPPQPFTCARNAHVFHRNHNDKKARIGRFTPTKCTR